MRTGGQTDRHNITMRTDRHDITMRRRPSACRDLTHVVGGVAGGLQGVVDGGLLGEAEVGELQDGVALLSGVQQVLRLERER